MTDPSPAPLPPLHGVTVVDVSELLPGPFLSQCLVDLGASVTKVERPPHGDPLRRARPAAFTALNHGKTSRSLDLKTTEGRDELLDLLREADVFIEGSRPGAMDRLGAGYDVVGAANPRIVYVSLSGYGQDGPFRTTAGHDLNYQAVGGLLSLSGADPVRPGLGVGLPVSDYVGATYAVTGVLAALLQRATTGRGQHVDVSITDTVTHWLGPMIADVHSAGTESLPAQRASRFGKSGYDVFPTRDGRWLAVGALEKRFLDRLHEALGLRREGDETPSTVNSAVEAALGDLDAHDALALLNRFDVPASEVVTPYDVPGSPHARARELFTDVEGLPIARFPLRLHGMTTKP